MMLFNRRLLAWGLRSNSYRYGKKVQLAMFSTEKPNNINNNSNQSTTTQSQKQFTPQQQHLIQTHQPDQLFNTLINLDAKHNFQKELILAKKSYQKSTKQLRASILFEDLLKSELTIPIYDTKGKPYTHMWMKNLFNVMFLCLTIWFFKQLERKDAKNKVFLQRTSAGKLIKSIFIGFASWFMIVGFWRYLKFQRRFVQSILYDTKSQSFTLKKRGFFGGQKSKEVSRFKLVYTENQFLNKKGTNYFNLDTKEEYSIPYKESWIKQDLFSHLIAQRIKL